MARPAPRATRKRVPRPWLAGLALLAGCRVAPLGGPLDWPGRPLDLNVSEVAAQSGAIAPAPPPPAPPPGAPQLPERLRIPTDLPGAEAPLPVLPAEATPQQRSRLLDELFPQLPPLIDEAVPRGPGLTLAELQRLAQQHPTLRQAAADVEAARGAAVQAGLPPNPLLGFEGDTIGTGGTAGQQGGKLEQVIKTAGKLKLAQAAALVDVVFAEIALRRARFDRAQQVRSAYFEALIAQENLRFTRAIAQITDEVFRVTVAQMRGGLSAPYEPFQSRSLAAAARANLEQARVRVRAAWQVLAAVVGRPDLPVSPLAGAPEMPPPAFSYDSVRDRMLAVHTDLRAAEAGVLRARYNLRLAEVTPVPDVSLKLVVQKDYSTPPFYTTANVEIGVPVPVWDRNQGNIQQAQGLLARALEEAQRARLDLLGRLADAAQRFDANRRLAEIYRKVVLPDQARAYRGVLLRYQQEPDKINFTDVVTAQTAFTTSLGIYLNALEAQWLAAVDLAALAQTDDLYSPCGVSAGQGPPLAPGEYTAPRRTCRPRRCRRRRGRSRPRGRRGCRPRRRGSDGGDHAATGRARRRW
jgi:cobalt-zinc-cadmium efflux system outer membrane protein